jgi:hypothetical protein
MFTVYSCVQVSVYFYTDSSSTLFQTSHSFCASVAFTPCLSFWRNHLASENPFSTSFASSYFCLPALSFLGSRIRLCLTAYCCCSEPRACLRYNRSHHHHHPLHTHPHLLCHHLLYSRNCLHC